MEQTVTVPTSGRVANISEITVVLKELSLPHAFNHDITLTGPDGKSVLLFEAYDPDLQFNTRTQLPKTGNHFINKGWGESPFNAPPRKTLIEKCTVLCQVLPACIFGGGRSDTARTIRILANYWCGNTGNPSLKGCLKDNAASMTFSAADCSLRAYKERYSPLYCLFGGLRRSCAGPSVSLSGTYMFGDREVTEGYWSSNHELGFMKNYPFNLMTATLATTGVSGLPWDSNRVTGPVVDSVTNQPFCDAYRVTAINQDINYLTLTLTLTLTRTTII